MLARRSVVASQTVTRASSRVVVGLDLSLTQTGMCAVPERWNLDWTRPTVAVAGQKLTTDAPLRAKVLRLQLIRDAVLAFCDRARATDVALLNYAFNKTMQAHQLGELGGVVKLALVEAGLPVHVVVESSARKLLGRAPRKDAKIWAVGKLMSTGAPPHWPVDCLDAFVAANIVLAETGGDAIVLER